MTAPKALLSSPCDPWFGALALSSHQRFVGSPLASEEQLPATASDPARWLYEDAPFGLLAHDGSADPLFVYANRTAQRCFEYDWDAFVGLPSRLSAEQDDQEDRDALLHSVATRHYATGYRGRRVAASGRHFWIEDVTMWELVDDAGVRHGQAAVFRSWTEA